MESKNGRRRVDCSEWCLDSFDCCRREQLVTLGTILESKGGRLRRLWRVSMENISVFITLKINDCLFTNFDSVH
jgi:hypothetical protein